MERGSGGMVTTASERSDVGRGDGDDQRLESRRPSNSRVHRVADFAKWATQVAEAAAADAATASSSTDWRLEHRQRNAAKPVVPTSAMPVVPTTAAADTHQGAGAADRASREAARLVTSSPNAARQGSDPSVQIGARAHSAASAGGGFRVTATIDGAIDDFAQNDAESQRRLRSATAPRATRHSRAPVNDNIQRKRKRALTADRGRRVLGSRLSDELRGVLKNTKDTRLGVADPRRRAETGGRLIRPTTPTRASTARRTRRPTCERRSSTR